MNEVEKLNGICFWLIKMVNETNAEEATMEYKNVMQFGKPLGDWQITIKKIQK